MQRNNKSISASRIYDQTKTMDNRLRKYRAFGTYVRNIFKSSLITSFPEIATTKSSTKRLIKSLVFIVCTIGFSYQTLDFLKMYLSYPTVVNVQITNPLMVDQPGITICNLNRRRRSYICEVPDNDCTTIMPDLFCYFHPMQCPGNDPKFAYTSMPYTDVVEDEFFWQVTKNEVHNESIFKICEKNIEGNNPLPCKKPYMPVPVILASGEPNYCYTVESQYGEPNAQPDTYANFFTMEINLFSQPEDYFLSTTPIRMQIALHDRKSRINPFFEGYTLKGGIKYMAYVSMISKERLPPPYDTNCTDYLKKWRKNNGTGPLNEIMCVEQCKLKKLLEKGLCIDKTVNYPHEEQLCKKTQTFMTGEILKECYSQCGYACSDRTYEVQFQEVDNSDYMCSPEDVWCKQHLIRTTFNFLKFRHTSYIYEPKFESIEMFSYVGGYMGMWLGLSLVSLFDLFETLCYLMFYPIGRALHKRQKMKKLEAIAYKRYESKFGKTPTSVY